MLKREGVIGFALLAILTAPLPLMLVITAGKLLAISGSRIA
jgi:hypothetical protein